MRFKAAASFAGRALLLAVSAALAFACLPGCGPASSAVSRPYPPQSAPAPSSSRQVVSAPQPESTPPPEYEMLGIARRTERGGRWISFADMPGTDAERAVALRLQTEITGEFWRLGYLEAGGAGADVKARIGELDEGYAGGMGLMRLRVDELCELGEQELERERAPGTGGPLLRGYAGTGGHGSYGEYVRAFLATGNAVVRARFVRGYTEAALAANAALYDGGVTAYYYIAGALGGKPVLADALFFGE